MSRRVTFLDDLSVADKGSFYTIIGAGGDLQEWVDGYEEMMVDAYIGKPTRWYTTNGRTVNAYTKPANPEVDGFQDDLTFLMFPLDGLHVGKLALFKIQMHDRWFDDIVSNIFSETRQ